MNRARWAWPGHGSLSGSKGRHGSSPCDGQVHTGPSTGSCLLWTGSNGCDGAAKGAACAWFSTREEGGSPRFKLITGVAHWQRRVLESGCDLRIVPDSVLNECPDARPGPSRQGVSANTTWGSAFARSGHRGRAYDGSRRGPGKGRASWTRCGNGVRPIQSPANSMGPDRPWIAGSTGATVTDPWSQDASVEQALDTVSRWDGFEAPVRDSIVRIDRAMFRAQKQILENKTRIPCYARVAQGALALYQTRETSSRSRGVCARRARPAGRQEQTPTSPRISLVPPLAGIGGQVRWDRSAGPPCRAW